MLSALHDTSQKLTRTIRSVVGNDRVEGFQPLARLERIDVGSVGFGSVAAHAPHSLGHRCAMVRRVPATNEGLTFAGPVAMAALVRSGEVHPRELVELALRRIEALNPRLNAFRVVMAEEALAAAEEVSRDGQLAGVPVAIKGDTPVAGQVTTRGSKTYGPAARTDAEIVRRLRAAGAIPIGITNVPELMIWPWTASDATGITRNPWDLSRTPGGSSGGSAAAVAAGLVPCATGSDGGGSIRIPAACCGLVGMKPSRGRVSAMPEGEHWLGLSSRGGLARTVRDSALMLDAIQGTIDGDTDRISSAVDSYLEAAGSPPGRLRIAITTKAPAGVLVTPSADQRRGLGADGLAARRAGP